LRFSLDSHGELQFSNPEKGSKSEENDLLLIRRLATGLGPDDRSGRTIEARVSSEFGAPRHDVDVMVRATSDFAV